MNRRTKGEQRAFRDGYEMCGECIEKYLTEGGKKRLNTLIMSVRNAVDIEDLPNSAEGEYIKKEELLGKMADYVSSGYAESANDFEEYSKIVNDLQSYSFPNREKGVPEFLSKYEGEWVSADREKGIMDKIKAEIEEKISHYDHFQGSNTAHGLEIALEIIDKHISGKETNGL